jgi:hypothetical protein
VSERIRHLRLTLVMSAAVLVLATAIAYVTGGAVAAIGVAAGVALVAASYTASTLAIAWADTVNPRLVFPVGMGMYVTKFSLFGVMLIAIGATDWAGKIAMAMGIIIGVLAWTGAQIWWTTHHAHPYVSAS